MVHNVNFNGLNFLNSPYFRNEEWFLCLKEFSFFEVSTTASTEKYAIRHWEYVSPTLKKNRRIKILFDIIADTEEKRRFLLKKVQRAFSPEQNPSPFNKNLWKELTFEDVNWDIRSCNCQIVKWIQLSDFANQKWVWISVELITDSSEFKSSEIQVLENWRNTRFWKRLWTTLWFNWEYYRDTITYQWVVDSPMVITLRVVADNPAPNKKINIIHEWNWEHESFQINSVDLLSLQEDDIILIDTDKRKVLLIDSEHSVDITWMVTLWSQRPLLKLWDNTIAVDTWASEKTINVDIERNEVF